MIRRRKNLENACLEAFDPPISLFDPETAWSPLILASPHSGRLYPKAFQDRSGLTLKTLRQNEDAYIDDMLGFAKGLNIPLLTALFPRCFVDVNRAADETPVNWKKAGAPPSTARAEMGLGVIPTIIADKVPIYKRQPKSNIVTGRLDKLYYPYHDSLQTLIEAAHQKFGQALLLDCHSMPGFTQMGQRRPDIVLGDRHGTSCYPETITKLESLFLNCGYSVVRNYPYAGGFVTANYGDPENMIEVIQIEINRDLYFNPISMKKKSGFSKLSNDLKDICEAMQSQLSALPLAAE